MSRPHSQAMTLDEAATSSSHRRGAAGAALAASRPLKILLLAERQPDRAHTVIDHINALTQGSRHHLYYLNSRNWTAPQAIEIDDFDAVIIHYSISIIHDQYLPSSFRARIKAFRGLKAMFIQDEYREVDAYTDSMIDLGIHVLFTCVPENAIDRVYPRLRARGVQIVPTLTGFVPEHLARAERRPLAERPFDIVYRGRPLPFHLGRLAFEKTEIAMRTAALAKQYGLSVDVDWREEARIYGARWVDFMSCGRATLGTESGASIVDFDGSIAAAVEAYRAKRPNAAFIEVAEAALSPHEGNIVINTISPRAFEAISLGTALILFPGHYSGILEAERHYIPLAKDFSNFAEVVDRLCDLAFLDRLTSRAHDEIIASGHYAYDGFVREVDDVLTQAWALRFGAGGREAEDAMVDPEAWRRALDARVAQCLEAIPTVPDAANVGVVSPSSAGSAMPGRAAGGWRDAVRRLLRNVLPASAYSALRLLVQRVRGA